MLSKADIMAPKKKTVFKKPGQKKPTPPKDDSLRIFYTSLLKQNKNSQMAWTWCLEHGLLTKKQTEYAIALLGLTKLSI